MTKETRRTWAEIHLDRLAHNYHELRKRAPESGFVGLVKANAYGHGALPIARALAAQGISAFCVACLEEGIQLRKGGIRGEILILGYTPPARSPCCAGTNSPKPQWISPTPCSSAKPANPCRSTWPLTPGCTAWVSPAITWRRSFKSSP